MDIEKVKEVAEVVKSLNFTFDGKLNSETLRDIVEVIAPYYKWYLLKGFILQVLGMVVALICIYWITKALRQYWVKERDNE